MSKTANPVACALQPNVSPIKRYSSHVVVGFVTFFFTVGIVNFRHTFNIGIEPLDRLADTLTQVLDAAAENAAHLPDTGAACGALGIGAYSYSLYAFLLCQSIAAIYFAFGLTRRLTRALVDVYNKFDILTETQNYFEKAVSDFGMSLREHSGNSRDKQLEKLSVGMGSLWNELNKLKHGYQQQFSYYQSAAAVATAATAAACGANASNNATIPPTSDNCYPQFGNHKDFGGTRNSNGRTRSVIKTQFGAFDMSSQEGRDRWKQMIQSQNKKQSYSRPTQRTGSFKFHTTAHGNKSEKKEINTNGNSFTRSSPPTHSSQNAQEVQGSITKFRDNGSNTNASRPTQLFMTAAETAAPETLQGTNNSTPGYNTLSSTPPISEPAMYAPTTASNNSHHQNSSLNPSQLTISTGSPQSAENSSGKDPKTAPPIILTSADLKAKLEEGEKKQYRRLFVPGRGWMSAKRLHEESQILEQAEKEQQRQLSAAF